jgi:hypothetical protein
VNACHAPAEIALGRSAECRGKLCRIVGRRAYLGHRRRAFVGSAVQPSGCITAPLAADRVDHVFGDADPPQSGAVDDRRMPPKAAQQHRPVGRDGIRAIRQLRWSRATSGPIQALIQSPGLFVAAATAASAWSGVGPGKGAPASPAAARAGCCPGGHEPQ